MAGLTKLGANAAPIQRQRSGYNRCLPLFFVPNKVLTNMPSPSSSQAQARALRRAAAWALGLPALLLLTGCGTTLMAGLDTVMQAWRGGSDVVDAVETGHGLNPQYRYLRVHVGDRVGLMVQAGATSADPATPTAWFSADGAVLRLVQGRLVGMNDGARSFAAQAFGASPAPAAAPASPTDWKALVKGQALVFQQTTDLQPGHRLGKSRLRVIKPSAAPTKHHAKGLVNTAQWFEESTPGQPHTSSWYAVDLAQAAPQVLYGQTCLENNWCISWQPWGTKP